MSEIRKITYGWVTQVWDSESREFLGQDFTCGDQVEYEDENGESIDIEEPEYRCFDMVQNAPTILEALDDNARS
jgi:hypothetical protein